MSESKGRAEFDAQRACADIHRLCALGPRPTGSPAQRRQRELLRQELHALGFSTHLQAFDAVPASEPERSTVGVNLIARHLPERDARILLGAHCDTRPIADEDPDPLRRREPILGANDNASGCAVLLELARGIAADQLDLGVDLIFFDAEEYVFHPYLDDLAVGSTRFARRLIADRAVPRYAGAVIVDIVARAEMLLSPDGESAERAGWLVEEIWSTADRLRLPGFSRAVQYEVFDDHCPLLDAGIPAINLIDVDDPRWHTHEDRPEFCSPAALDRVGRLLHCWLRDRASRSS